MLLDRFRTLRLDGDPVWRGSLPLREHLTGNPAARHARLAPLGPNDGSTLVQGALAAPGLTYPVWGADHYMRVAGGDLLLARLLGLLARVPEAELLGMAA